MANEYLALEEFKVAGELKGLSFMDYDATRSIASASRAIEEYCGREFWLGSAGEVRYFTPLDHCSVQIEDVVSIGTVQTDYDGDGTYETTWAATDYTVYPLNAAAHGKPYEELRARPYTYPKFPCWDGSVKVTGQFGWAAVPDQVKTATMLLSEKLVKRVREAPFGVVGIGADSFAVRVIRADPEMMMLLDPLVRGQGVMVA